MVYDAYNLTGVGNSSGIVPFMKTVNSNLMFDFLGIGILLAVFIVTFLSMQQKNGGDTGRAFAGASFLSFALSMILILLDLIPNYALYITLVATAISIVFIRSN